MYVITHYYVYTYTYIYQNIIPYYCYSLILLIVIHWRAFALTRPMCWALSEVPSAGDNIYIYIYIYIHVCGVHNHLHIYVPGSRVCVPLPPPHPYVSPLLYGSSHREGLGECEKDRGMPCMPMHVCARICMNVYIYICMCTCMFTFTVILHLHA